jgi:hypothetical protein
MPNPIPELQRAIRHARIEEYLWEGYSPARIFTILKSEGYHLYLKELSDIKTNMLDRI